MAFLKPALAIPAIAAILLTGCASPDPNAKPTYTCTPATGSPAPCYKAEHDLQAKEDKLYAEAEAVYRKFAAEDERIFRIGGTAEATPIIQQTTTGDFQKAKLIAYQALRGTRTRLVSGRFKIASVERAPARRAPSAEVAITYCLDASTARLETRGEGSWLVGYASDVLQFVRESGNLKISTATSRAVQRC